MADDLDRALTQEEREAAILAHFQAGGCFFPVQAIVAVSVAEFRVLPRKITPGNG